MRLMVFKLRLLHLVVACLFFAQAASAQHFTQTNLVADTAGAAANTDPTLLNPWGLARGTTGPWWTANNGDGLSNLYDGSGNKRPLVVNVPAASGSGTGTPTGVAFNASSSFNITPGN